MNYYSTNKISPEVTLAQAVVKGLAPDKGLYMPERLVKLPSEFFENIDKLSFQEIACVVAGALFGEDINEDELNKIVCETLSFDTPTVQVNDNIFSLELFHGPTAAFKDVGARFMARMLSYFISKGALGSGKVTVLVATSGDTGSAVANGFLGVEGIEVIVLYPKGKVSEVQEMQFTTLGQNITAIEVEGTFDDCQRLVKMAFLDSDLNSKLTLTSANSINVARFLPQSFYYFNSYAALKSHGLEKNVVFSVPSGNFGNITAGLFAQRMGLPIKRFIAANNRNDIFLHYLLSGEYKPQPSITTVANAMDVGDPSNFARIMDLYGNNHGDVKANIEGCSYGDEKIILCIKECYNKHHYLLDPHGACGYLSLVDHLKSDEVGVFLETAHPAKFIDTVSDAIGNRIEIPENLKQFMSGTKSTTVLDSQFDSFKEYLMSR